MPWEQMASMPTATYGCCTAVVSGKIYVIGGYNTSTTNLEYDPTLDTFAVKQSASVNVRDHQIAVRGGLIYVVQDGDSNEFRTYNPAANGVFGTITDSGAGTTDKRYCWVVADASENIYQGGGTSSLAVHRYSGSWSNNLTTQTGVALEHSKAVLAHNGKIYISGGVVSGTSTYSTQMLEYTPPTTWATKTAMPVNRWAHGIAAANPWIYIGGGSVNGFNNRTFYRYDPVLDTYTALEDLPFSGNQGFKTAFAVVGGYLYAFGGLVDSTATAEVWRIEVGYDELATTIEAEAELRSWPDLIPDEVAGELEVTVDFEPVFIRTGGGIPDSFIDIGSTGVEPFDSLFPGTDVFPDTTLYPGGDF